MTLMEKKEKKFNYVAKDIIIFVAILLVFIAIFFVFKVAWEYLKKYMFKTKENVEIYEAEV